MKSFISVSLAIIGALCLLVGSEKLAWGYVDPGSGLLTLQTLTSVIGASIYLLRRRILAMFQSGDNPAREVPPATASNPRELA